MRDWTDNEDEDEAIFLKTVDDYDDDDDEITMMQEENVSEKREEM